MTDDVVTALVDMLGAVLGEIHTCLPGTVVSYNAATRRAVVRPSLDKQLADGRVLEAPQIVEVPVQFPMGLTYPIAAGAGVLLHFTSRSLETWLDGGERVPDDPRQFDLSDCIAVPGVSHGGNTTAADPDNFVLSFGGASITFTPGGEIKLHGTKISTDTQLISTAAITSKTVTLDTHNHGSGPAPTKPS
jgi:hypothetical protein